MALHHPLRLRRALSLSVSLLHRFLHGPVPISSHLLPTPSPTPTPSATRTASFTQLARPFTSTTALFRKAFDPETDEIGPDTILFEGCDYKHWLITMDFRDSNPTPTRDQMIDTYLNTAAQVFGSVEEAKKKIYALSTTTYQGFQVECSEETSDKFKGIPGVVFVLPDSYIDPANKEYGGDKYINGEIIPRPPPVHYTKRNRDRPHPREQNYGPPPQQNYGPAPQQNYGPAPQQNYRPPPSQNYGPAPSQNYGPPPQQNYGPAPQQNYGPAPQQNYRPPPSQNYGPPQSQNYGPTPQQNDGRLPQDQGPPPQQNYASPRQQNYRPPQQQGYAPQPHQSYESPPQQGYAPRVQRGDYFNSPNNASGRGERNYAHGQGDLRSHVPTEQRGFSEDVNSGFSQGGSFEQSGERRNF